MIKNPDVIIDALRAQGYRITKARENILSVLCKDGHYTVEALINKLKETQEDVNVATVYNNLNFLVSEGIVNEYNFNNKNSVYELNVGLHAHIICVDCNEVKNIEIPEFIKIQEDVEKSTGFEIINSKLDMYGRCYNCSQNKK